MGQDLNSERPPLQFNDMAGGVEESTSRITGVESNSQHIILSHLMSVLPFRSVVDFGCGGGHWLSAAASMEVFDLKGLDLVPVPEAHLQIPRERIEIVDLSSRIDLGREYDLAISTEVAEHIAGTASSVFIENLCRAADVVLFSAAVPYQGGVHHVNENWVEYWAEKFFRCGFICFDSIRPTFWNDTRIHYYYRQNSMLYVHKKRAAALGRIGMLPDLCPKTYIHPELLLQAVNRALPPSRRNFDRDVDLYYNYSIAGRDSDRVAGHHAYGQEDLWNVEEEPSPLKRSARPAQVPVAISGRDGR